MPNDDVTVTSETPLTELIRDDILTGRHRPGNELALATISEDFDVSMSEVRVALLQLVQQRLVVRTADEEFQVVSVSRRDLEELTALRQLVEGTALRSSIEDGDREWVAGVVAAYDALDAQDRLRGDSTVPSIAWRAAHLAFHDALCVGTDNVRLIELSRALRDEAEIYRGFSGVAGPAAQHRDVPAEHLLLQLLAVERRPDEAVEALKAHLEGTKDVLLATTLTT